MILTLNYLNVVNGVPERLQVVMDEPDIGFRDAIYYATTGDYAAAVSNGQLNTAAQARIDIYQQRLAVQRQQEASAPVNVVALNDAIRSIDDQRAALVAQLAEAVQPTLDAVAAGELTLASPPVLAQALTSGD